MTPGAHPQMPSRDPAAGEEVETASQDLSTSSILLVDDNEQNLELLLAYLEELPCKILTARDGFEALEVVRVEKPNLVLLDVMMPRMSGFQVCAKLKKDPETRETPVVMVTALNEIGDVERAVDAGADDFLTKPVNKLELLTRAKSLLRLSLLQRQLHKTLAELKAMGAR
jgi:two-component system, OmpR family, alkaline phosphatase synthesis response regulator PhoP